MANSRRPFVPTVLVSGVYRPRRKRVKHYDEPGHAHFLTFSCFQRLPLLSKPRSCEWFLEALAKAREKNRFDLWAWVIMPEHVAYLKENAPDFLSRLTVVNRRRTYHRFWQAGAGQDHNVVEPKTALQIIEYIHGNPVRRGLTATPEEWPWSSAADWAGRPTSYIRVDRTISALETIEN